MTLHDRLSSSIDVAIASSSPVFLLLLIIPQGPWTVMVAAGRISARRGSACIHALLPFFFRYISAGCMCSFCATWSIYLSTSSLLFQLHALKRFASEKFSSERKERRRS
uniref:Uncharacterized protein n=1 Tax=Hordeum vulgare subsp. vulgare TaxID=112509 RepID=A0A8I6WH95_HORVV